MYCSVPRIAPSWVIACVTVSSEADVAFARSAFARLTPILNYVLQVEKERLPPERGLNGISK